MAKWQGLGPRIRERLLAVGYEKDGRADIPRFCLDNRLLPSNVYRWVNANVLPEQETLLRLAALLGTTPGWLLFGEGEAMRTPEQPKRPVPISGGSDQPAPLPGGAQDNPLSLIGRWLRELAWGLLPRPWSYA